MLNAASGKGLAVLVFGLTSLPLHGSDWYVAPNGSPFGAGTLSNPYDLGTAFSGSVGQPGDTFWLRGGDYKLGHLNTTLHGAPGKPLTFRQVHGESATIDGSIAIFNSPGYVVFRDFTLYSSDTNRVSAQTGAGFNVTDISILPGISCFAPNLSFINLVVHDQTRHGFYLSQNTTNSIVYGCVVYNNGWESPDNAEGHGLYVQGEIGTRWIKDNIVFNNSGASMHIYENAFGRNLAGVFLEGNLAFGSGAIQTVRLYRDWIVGVDSPAGYADNIVIRNNMGYLQPGAATQAEMQIGRDSTNGSVIVTENYLPLGLLMNNWRTATVSRNLVAPPLTNSIINLNGALSALWADWDQNTYVHNSAGNEVLLDSKPCTFSAWQAATGFDLNSTFVVGDLHGTRIFIRTNDYEPGRAEIVVYNWDRRDNVAVDVSSVLAAGSAFVVRNVEDFFAPPVSSGVLTGSSLQLPMTNLTAAVPNGPLVAPPPTGPVFNVFLLLPRDEKLRINVSNGLVQVTWPVSLGATVLQTLDSLSGQGGWIDTTNSPAVVADRFMVTEPQSPGAKFYRLRPQ